MSNKHLATLSFDVPARQRESQIEHQIAGAAGISGTVATPQGAAVGRWLAAFGIAVGLAAVAFFGTGFLLVTYTGDEMLATRSETAMATAVIPPMQTNAAAAREIPQTETIPEAAPSMQTNAEAVRETPQTETTPEAPPSMQTNAEAVRETPQTETIPEAPPSMQTNAEAVRETPQTETIPEAAPSMQTNAEAVRETPQTETVLETTPIPLVQTFRAFQGPLNPTGEAKWQRPAAAPQLARAVPTKAVAKPSPSRRPKSLDDLIAQIGVASLPRPRPFFCKDCEGQITRHIQPAAGQGVILKQHRDDARPSSFDGRR